jgi:hypothetical protein
MATAVASIAAPAATYFAMWAQRRKRATTLVEVLPDVEFRYHEKDLRPDMAKVGLRTTAQRLQKVAIWKHMEVTGPARLLGLFPGLLDRYFDSRLPIVWNAQHGGYYTRDERLVDMAFLTKITHHCTESSNLQVAMTRIERAFISSTSGDVRHSRIETEAKRNALVVACLYAEYRLPSAKGPILKV